MTPSFAPNLRRKAKSTPERQWSTSFLVMTTMFLLISIISSHSLKVTASLALHTPPKTLLKSISKPVVAGWKAICEAATAVSRKVAAKPDANYASGGGAKISAVLSVGISTKGLGNMVKPDIIDKTIMEKLTPYAHIAIHVGLFCFVGYHAYKKIRSSQQNLIDENGAENNYEQEDEGVIDGAENDYEQEGDGVIDGADMVIC